MNLQNILTEKRNPNTLNIDELSSLEIAKRINEEDQAVPTAVEKVIPVIAQVVDCIVDGIQRGGRLIYIGAGTSGRLGILDASECPPTYGTPAEMVRAVIAGGDYAIQFALEGAEDDEELGKNDINALNVGENDVVIGIAASGRTPYTAAAMKEAKSRGAVVGAVVCSPNSIMGEIADYSMVAEVGPEVVTGSTRMKAGTAQKLILNMLSTISMIRLGKVYGNLMVDVMPSNEKLRERAKLIVAEAAGVSLLEADAALKTYGSTKAAILSLVTGLEGDAVTVALDAHKGHLRNAIKENTL
jgi:N-acetylmuramic acid 6-phosphate etherase